MIKIQYESLVDWHLHRDILCCSPCFHGRERCDCVLVDSDEGVSFARLHTLLELESPTRTKPTCLDPPIPLALVSYLDPVFGPMSIMEWATDLRRFCQRPPTRTEVIPARSIIHGALLVSILDSSRLDDYLANDLFDHDMYSRFRLYTKDNKFYTP